MHQTHTIVIGAGISGLSAARLLFEKGVDHLVLEKDEKPGGLVKCVVVDGHLFHRVGGHVFNTRVERVANWFWSQFNRDNEFLSARRKAGVFMDGLFMGYPVENYLYMLDEPTIRRIFTELLVLEKQERKSPFSYDNFEAFLIGNFGKELYELYFKPYNHKIWKTDLSKVDLPWLEGKLPMPDGREIILSNILRKEESNMVHSTFYYPRQNGSQFIANRLADGLNIKTGINVDSIERIGKKWVINGEYSAEHLIYTGDIRRLADTLKGVSGEIQALALALHNLQSNGTSNLLCETDDTTHSWLYLPNSNIPAHRIIYTGNFSPANQPSNSRRSCTVEFSGKTEMRTMQSAIKQLPGNLKIIDHNYESNSYVIQYKGDRTRIKQLKDALLPINFYLAGRFAEWEYYNMDKAMERAMEVVEELGNWGIGEVRR